MLSRETGRNLVPLEEVPLVFLISGFGNDLSNELSSSLNLFLVMLWGLRDPLLLHVISLGGFSLEHQRSRNPCEGGKMRLYGCILSEVQWGAWHLGTVCWPTLLG